MLLILSIPLAVKCSLLFNHFCNYAEMFQNLKRFFACSGYFLKKWNHFCVDISVEITNFYTLHEASIWHNAHTSRR